MSRKKKIPVPDPKPEEYKLPGASSGDMTGLIPTPADDEQQRDSYSDIVNYMAQE